MKITVLNLYDFPGVNLFKAANDEMSSCHILKVIDKSQIDESSSSSTDHGNGLSSGFL